MPMFTNLLRALFGTRHAADLARSAQAAWRDWLAPISADVPCGVDPSYDDGFLAMRDEVSKLSDVDHALIVETGERLLKHAAKDVRVAVYYAYGRVRRDGAEGVAAGLELLAALVDTYGATLLPNRPVTRRAAFEWLCGGTFADRLDSLQGLTGALLERAVSALALIVEHTSAWPVDAQPRLEPLMRRFEGRVESPQGSSADPVPQDVAKTTATFPAASAAFQPASAVSSTEQLLDQARRMAIFLRNEPSGYLAAHRLLRCIRWDRLDSLPPHDARGRTRMIGPRNELRTKLKRLLLQKQWPQLLEEVESAFAEGANHLWLDLQYYGFVAQERAGGDYARAREIAVTDCALMLERLAGLEHLYFEDGTPFADDATLEWIARDATVRDLERGEAALPVGADAGGVDWREVEAQAVEVVSQQGLDAALAWLQRVAPSQGDAAGGERERFVRQLVMARVSERADRSDTALHLLTALDAEIRQFRLTRWEPSLAFDVKQQLLRLLRARVNRKDADKATLSSRIDVLTGELIAIDAARAVSLG